MKEHKKKQLVRGIFESLGTLTMYLLFFWTLIVSVLSYVTIHDYNLIDNLGVGVLLGSCMMIMITAWLIYLSYRPGYEMEYLEHTKQLDAYHKFKKLYREGRV